MNNYSDSILYIDLAAIRKNYSIIKNKAASSEVAAVVKANGYGLGVGPIAKTFEKAGCKKFFVATLDEALELRSTFRHPREGGDLKKLTQKDSRLRGNDRDIEIFVFHGIRPGQEKTFLKEKITPVLNNLHEIKLWQKTGAPAAIHVDTGMNRLGLTADEAKNLDPGLNVGYLMSHMACADEPENPLNKEQLKRFNHIRKLFPNAVKSLANSSAAFLGDCYHFDLVRPGISLYGGSPNPARENPVKPVITLTSRIIQLREIDSRQPVGYGATATLPEGSRLAVIPVGYADGYLRALSDAGECYIGGYKAKIAGRVSMDLVILDVTGIPSRELYLGREVELIGKNLSIDDVAFKAGTISYEILTRLGKRFKRVYVGEGND